MTPGYTTAADLLGAWLAEVERGDPPARFRLPAPFAALDLRPGRLVLFGGAPGGGKTAALLQLGVDLLRLNPAARVLVANVEMAPVQLAERVVARVAGVPLTAITDRTLTPDQLARVKAAVAGLAPVAGRLAFLHPPYTLDRVAAAAHVDAFDASVLVVDYIQRFGAGDSGQGQREQLEAAATALRRFCDAGAVVLAASAVARQKGAGGATYAGLNLASFRGSSELEYGTDAAYMLVPTEAGGVVFRCEKNRYGAVADIATRFDPATQAFEPAPAGVAGFDAATPAPEKKGKAKRGQRCDD